MAASAVTATRIATKQDVTERRAVDVGTLAVGAGDYVNDGLTVDLRNVILCAPARIDRIEAYSDVTGYTYKIPVPTVLAEAKLVVFQQDGTTGPLKQLPVAATPAAVVADVIQVRATRRKG